MTVSMEHSTIQYNSLQSAIINTQVDEFLRKGGEITSTPLAQPVPRPYGRVSPEVAAVRPLRRHVEAKVKPQRPNASRFTPELVEKIRQMAKTMTQPEVSAITGEAGKTLYKLASDYDFTFKPSMGGGIKNLVFNVSDPEKDAANAERIKSFMEIGVTRRQAAKHMGISSHLFSRLLRDFNIDYPKAVNGLS